MPLTYRRIVCKYIVSLFFVIAAAYAVNGNKLLQAGGLDAYIYTSLIKDYSNIIDRYGAVYYATRIAHIFPAHAIQVLFPDNVAYYIHKIVFFSIAIGAVFVIALRMMAPGLALLMAAWAAFSPQFARPFLWDHYEGSGLAYHLAATACIMVTIGGDKLRDFLLCGLAGILLALSINTNPTLAVMGGGVMLAAIFLEWPSFKQIGYKILSAAAGFFAMYAIMIAYMAVAYPVFGLFFEMVTFGMTKWGVGGGAANWYIPMAKVLATPAGLFTLSPFVVLATLIVTVLRERHWRSPDRIMVASLIYLGLVCIFFLWAHFVVKSVLLHMFYYNIYMVPATILAMTAIVSNASKGDSHIVFPVAASVGLLIGARFFGDEVTPFLASLDMRFAIAAFVAVALVASLATALPRAIAFAVLMLMISVAPMPNIGFSPIDRVEHKAQEWDVHSGAKRLVEIVEAYAPKQEGMVGFWYANVNSGPDIYLNSAQSAFLWGNSRIQPGGSPEEGMPVLTEASEQRLRTFRFVVILSNDEQKLEAGIAELSRRQFAYSVRARGKQFGSAWGYHYVVLEMKKQG
jgi:hypothetical protein